MNQQEHRWQDDLRSLEADIDPMTARRLTDIRRTVLAAPARRWLRFGSLLPPAVGMTIAAAIGLWALGPHILVTPDPFGGNNTRLNPDVAELYEQIDFYSWLADTQWDATKG
jgi:hypothetical protein